MYDRIIVLFNLRVSLRSLFENGQRITFRVPRKI